MGDLDAIGDALTGKQASLQAILQKIAAGSTGSLIEGGGNPNTLPAAAAGNAEAALEAKQRPVEYAHSGTGNSAMVPGPASQVGTEQSHPLSPAATAAGTNSAIEATSASDPAIKAAAFNYLFTDTARRVVPYLPQNMPDATKVAHVQALMAVDEPQRAVYLSNLYAQMGSQKTAAEAVGLHYLKTAEGMPPALREAIEEKKEKHEKGESKEKEKSEEECAKEEEKEAALQTLSTLRSALANLNA